MIRSINEWRKHVLHRVNENEHIHEIPEPGEDVNIVKTVADPDDGSSAFNNENSGELKTVIDHAMALGLSKEDTIGVVANVFVDPAQAPDDISVIFVQDNLGEIISTINDIPEENFAGPGEADFTVDMIGNDLPFECIMYAPDNQKIAQLCEALNARIKKSDFKAVYENGIFFVNSLDKINENNRKIVLSLLREADAKNLSDKMKWKRRLHSKINESKK